MAGREPAQAMTEDELRAVSVLDRARARMAAQEAAEERQRQTEDAARRDGFYQGLTQDQINGRHELAAQGFTNQAAAEFVRVSEERRRGRIVELRDELARLTGGPFQMPTADDVDRELARNEAERQSWNSPPVRRMREWALESELARSKGGRVTLRRGHDPSHPLACTGPVSNLFPDDPRRRDCTANWPPGPGDCGCGCGGKGQARRALVPFADV
jgi:hypothetical protein